VLQIADARNAIAVTIDEENIHWGGRAQLLASLFTDLREKYPEVKWYQWYSSSKTANVPGHRWPDLPADGWVFDQYTMAANEYRSYVAAMAKRGQPLVSIVWAGVDWQPGDKQRLARPRWWDDGGWRLFYEQVAANQQHGIPTAFYLYELDKDRRSAALWKSAQACKRNFVERFTTDTLRYLKSGPKLPISVPKSRPQWIPAGCS
jgi:hypothetical protein